MLLPVVAGCGWVCYKVISYCGGRVQVLQNQVRQLQQQLSAYQGGSAVAAAYAPPAVHAAAGGSNGTFTDVLFFPDPAMPCHYMNNCRRHNCTYAHTQTNLTKLLSVLRSAQRTLDVCVFTITCDEIADALLQAHQRGVRVRIISDNDQAKNQGSDIQKFQQAGIPLKMDADEAHMHHKFAVVDGKLLMNGSFNWTRQAVLYNQENIVITDNPQLLVDAVYVIMAWATATNLANASGNLHIETPGATVRSFISNNIWRAPIAACALGGLMVVLFNLMSCIVLLRKSIAKKAGVGFGYGFVVGWCFVMAFFSLMCGLVMQGFTSTVEGKLTAESGWTPMMTGAFKATFVFGYIVAGMFVLFFLILVAAPSDFVDQQLLQRKRQLEMNTLSAAGGGGMAALQAGPI